MLDGFVTLSILHANRHKRKHKSHPHSYAHMRLSPEFNDNIIKLPIYISSGVLW